MSFKDMNETSVQHKRHSAKKYIVGYLLSLVLTAIAFILTLTHGVQLGPLLVIIVILAALQIFVQLYFFMHVTEGDGPPFHVAALALGLIFTFAIAFMSVWIMSFSSMVA